jgi:hypothetical protein
MVAMTSAAWPGNAPDLELAERALLAELTGAVPPVPAIAGVAAKVAGALSDLEKVSLSRAPLEIDASPVRRAAAMRVRVGVAIATAPPAGTAADPDAVAALLAEIDELLFEVNDLAVSAPPLLVAALSRCRSVLVKEAIDFSEVAHRYERPDLEPGPASAVRRRSRPARASPTGAQGGLRMGWRSRALWVGVAVAAAAALALQGYGYFARR